MVSRTKLEIGSIIFAFLSLIVTVVGFLWYTALLIKFYITMTTLTNATESNTATHTTAEGSHMSASDEMWYLNYIMYYIVTISILVSIMGLSFVFSILLTKGLLTRKAHLVKAYFIYGVTGVTFTSILAFLIIVRISLQVGFIIFAGCLLYSLFLLMIKKTYLEIAEKEHDQCCHKKIVEEKSISIKL